jgi:Bacterial regulatory proteins, tetR family
MGAAAEFVILSREHIDNDGPLSACQSPDFLTSASMPCQCLAIGDSGRGRVSASRPHPEPPPSIPAGRGYHHGDMRHALLDAALALIEAGEEQSVSLRTVAARAGVSNGAPYRHFKDHEALMAAVATIGFDRLLRALRRARESSGYRSVLTRELSLQSGPVPRLRRWPSPSPRGILIR